MQKVHEIIFYLIRSNKKQESDNPVAFSEEQKRNPKVIVLRWTYFWAREVVQAKMPEIPENVAYFLILVSL